MHGSERESEGMRAIENPEALANPTSRKRTMWHRLAEAGYIFFLVFATTTANLAIGQTSPPDNSRQIAISLEQQGKTTEAESAWRALLKAHPSSAEAYAHLGLLEARQEHYKEAVPLYRKALALNPAVPGLRLNLGLALFKGGDLKPASVEFERLLKGATKPDENQRLTILAGMAHYGLGEYSAATPYLKTAAARDTQNLQLRLALAHSCLWSKQYQCVMDTYNEMLSLNAESAEVDMIAGEAQDGLKNYDGAIEQFRAAVKADPTMPDVHFGLGYLLWTQKQYAEAAREFQAELANNPDNAQALAYLGDSDMQLNHSELSAPLLEKALRLNSGLELAHLDLGILDADAGRNDEALRELKTAAQLAPGDVNVHWRLGHLYKAIGNEAEAKAELQKASSLHKAEENALLEQMNRARAQAEENQAPPAAAPKQ
jgi:tetratricopeptide (TPR) repeat protein